MHIIIYTNERCDRMSGELHKKRIEMTLSSVQAKLADMQDAILVVSQELDELYMEMGDERPGEDTGE